MNINWKKSIAILFLLVLISMACNAPFLQASQNQSSNVNANTMTPGESPAAASTLAATVAAVKHIVMPPDPAKAGPINYDVDSSGTASQNRAPYGDSYDLNLFERPFTQNSMVYIPALDINTFSLSQDDTWFYVSMQMSGGDMNDKIGIDYGVELDTNHDGVGDYLVWAHPPYTTTWSTDTVQVYSDPNHDVGGASPEKSDANATTSAPYPGDGYETIIFSQGQGTDPDLAWVRLDPHNSSALQFAFKRTLAGPAFMWGVWADAGLKDPGKFNYNDRFTLVQAGSPIKGNANYPIKAIYQVDNTCWAAFGFTPTGYEPHLCPRNTPPKAPRAPGATPPPTCPWTPASCNAAGGVFTPPCDCAIIG